MDDDTNAAFRKGPPGCQDILVSLFYVLKSDMIVKILASIRQQSNVAESESALFVMSSIGRDVLKFLKQVRDAKPRNTAKGRRAALQDDGVRAQSAKFTFSHFNTHFVVRSTRKTTHSISYNFLALNINTRIRILNSRFALEHRYVMLRLSIVPWSRCLCFCAAAHNVRRY